MGWQDAPIVKPAAKKMAAWEDAPIVRRNEQAAPTPPEKPALTLASSAFPNARGEAPSPIPYPMSYGVLPKDVMYQPMRGAGFIGDALSLPTRAAGTAGGLLGYSGATGGKQGLEALADPETGLARPVRQWSGGLVSSGLSGGEDGRRGLLDYGKVAAGAIPYLAASVVEDPTALIGGAAKVAPKAIGGLAKKAVAPVGKTWTASKETAGNLAERAANKIQFNIIRPRERDELSGFKIGNVDKHGVSGSLEEVIGKSQAKIEETAQSLKGLIKQGKDAGARVDLNKAVFDVENEIFKNKAKEFGILREAPGALKDLKARIRILGEDAPRGKVDLVDGQYVKQALGDMAAFEHVAGKAGVTISKEDRAVSQLASRVYLKLKDQIEKAAPDGVKEQNEILSELIPVNRAALYRKLVADRNNVISLSDYLGALGTIAGGPKGLALWAAGRGTKSGTTAKALYGLARSLKAAKTPAEASFYAKKLEAIGVTAAEIQAISGAAELAPNAIPFRKVAEKDSTQPVAMRK